MLSLLVYSRDREKGKVLNDKCSSYIRKNRRMISAGECVDNTSLLGDKVAALDDSALFMLRKDEGMHQVSGIISSSEQNSYTVLVLRDADEIFDVVSPLLRPAGIVLDSFDENRTGRVIDEIYADYTRQLNLSGGPDYHFKIKGVDYCESFPNIYMIEVQSKRITFHTEAQSYEFYDSLDAVMKEAPEYFIRIHRSYVINMKFISTINFKDKTIVLKDNQKIFFSRNYAPELKNYYYKTVKEEGIS